jgi:hypothetical protein
LTGKIALFLLDPHPKMPDMSLTRYRDNEAPAQKLTRPPDTADCRKKGATAMKYISTIAFFVLAVVLSALAEDQVPYAYRPPAASDSFVLTLGDIMGATQLRHFKLSYAGKLGNWELASYELGQIEDSLFNAARLYQNIPVEKINLVEQPLVELSSAIKANNGARFASAFADLTTACNSCHEAAHVPALHPAAKSPWTSPSTTLGLLG